MVDQKPTLDQGFLDLCLACRTGDLELAEKYIDDGVDLNQTDEWDYTPLVLASICGHEDVLRLLLERGSTVNRDTFEGSRALYGALTDSIVKILKKHDIGQTVDASQPFAQHFATLLSKPTFISADLFVRLDDETNEGFKAHRFVFDAFFSSGPLKDFALCQDLVKSKLPKFKTQSWNFLFRYSYLSPTFDLSGIDVDDLMQLAQELGVPQMKIDVIEVLKQKSKANASKIKFEIQRNMNETARINLKSFLHSKIFAKELIILLDEENDSDDLEAAESYEIISSLISPSQKLDLIEDSHADIILATRLENSVLFYPAHRAVLSRAEYYETLFKSSFSECNVFHELEQEDLQIIDVKKLHTDPFTIPVIQIPELYECNSDLDRIHVTKILFDVLYHDDADIPEHLRCNTLMLSDSLLFDRLKKISSISLTKIEQFSPEFSESPVLIYDVLRVGWYARVHRIETFVARIFARNVSFYVKDPHFKDIVIESSERIKERQEVDSIELIDDIRYFVAKKYVIDVDELRDYGDLIKDMATDEFLERLASYNKDIELINKLLVDLGLDA
ncbi:hypothetical protein CANARDRAFT_27222 [[Candida] arabinofermentans NRRL YB-2248]|uniref:BTB domain-containing protein n=1 Tax=[Candida] arabinofermentans NRRL YB-2248 TaxID=983967 RepID=A0A1E4T541_9ASCO|nr:hypothetical protein CANARDRAFT_27222 [[Candida] arabinofermentans NRRL YB-2248]